MEVALVNTVIILLPALELASADDMCREDHGCCRLANRLWSLMPVFISKGAIETKSLRT